MCILVKDTRWIYSVSITDVVMNVVTRCDNGIETLIVFIYPGRSFEKVWVYIIPVKAEESSVLTLKVILKLLCRALGDWTKLRVVLVRAYVMI